MSMDIHALKQKIAPGEVPLERLAANPALSEKEKVTEAARQFESMLLRKILSEAQKPLFQSKYIDRSSTGEIYRDLTTQELADQISRTGEFGLARSLQAELQREAKSQAGNTGTKSNL